MQISSNMYMPEFVSIHNLNFKQTNNHKIDIITYQFFFTLTQGMEDPTLFHQYPMDNSVLFQLEDLDFESFSASPKNSSSPKRFNSESTQNSSLTQNPEQYSVTPPRPTKQNKTVSTTWSAYNTHDMMAPKASSSSSSKIISFENSNASSVTSQQLYNVDAASKVKKPKSETGYGENLDFAAAAASQSVYDNNSFLDHYDNQDKKAAASTTRNPTQAQDHVIAERKRREKLSQRFIALSAIVPGLKKVPFVINFMLDIYFIVPITYNFVQII